MPAWRRCRRTRLVCARFVEDDLDAYAAIVAEPEVCRYLGNGGPSTATDAWRQIAVFLGHAQLRGYSQEAALVERSTGALVGRAGSGSREGWPGLEVGWVLAPWVWGRGYATEAGLAWRDYAFRELGATELVSLIHRDNLRLGPRRGADRPPAAGGAGVRRPARACSTASRAAGAGRALGYPVDAVIARYTRPDLGAVWTDEAAPCELAGGRARGARGVGRAGRRAAPRRSRPIRARRARRRRPSAGEIERRTHHDVIAFTERSPSRSATHARWFHYGLTSSDVVDTALALQLRDAGALLLAGVDRALAAALARAPRSTARTPCMGRTHGVHAEPTTFGLKLLGWVVRARPRPRAARRARSRACASASSRAPSARTATSTRASRSSRCARLGLGGEPVADAGRPARPPRRAARSARAPAAARSTASPRRSATCSAPRCARRRSRSRRARRARPRCRTSATRSRCERICGPGARRARPTRSSASRTCRSGTSATSRTPRPSAWCCPTRPRARLPARPLRLGHRGPRGRRGADAAQHRRVARAARSAGRVLLALVEAGLAREAAYGSCSATRCARGTTSEPLRELAEADPERPRRSTSTRCSTRRLRPRTSHRLRRTPTALRSRRREEPSCLKRSTTSPPARCASSTRSRRPPAARRDRPHLGLRRRPAHADPRQGPRADRPVGRSGSRARRDIVPEPRVSRGWRAAEELRDPAAAATCRRLEMLPVECVVRGYLAGSGWKDYRATGAVCGIGCPTGLREADRLPEPIFTPATKARDRPTTRTSRPTGARELVGDERYAEVERVSLALYRRPPSGARARHHPGRHEVRARARRRRRGSCSATRRSRRTPRASGRPTSTRRAARRRPTTSSSCATGWRRWLGQDGAGARAARTRSSPARRRATARPTSVSPGAPSTTTSPRRWCAVKVTVLVRPKEGILDPQGEAIGTLAAPASATHAAARGPAAFVELEVEAADADEARASVERRRALLANALIERYEVIVDAASRSSVTAAPSASSPSPARATTATRCAPSARSAARPVPLWHGDADLPDVGAVLLPGGFSYGDYLRCGAIARFAPVMRRSRPSPARAARCSASATASRCCARPACCRACCAPNTSVASSAATSIARRARRLALHAAAAPGRRAAIPVKHHDGAWFARRRSSTAELERGGPGGAALRARTRTARSADVACVTNEAGNVLGLMPHPEHAVDALLGSTDGAVILGGSWPPSPSARSSRRNYC